jgi:hypothetical protein
VLSLTHTVRMLAEWHTRWQELHLLTLLLRLVVGILTSHTPPRSHQLL